MTSPVSGWYPDPSGLPGERFWNGTGWTNDTRAAQGTAATDAPQAYDGFGNPAPTTPAAPAPGLAPPPYRPTATGAPQDGGYGSAPQYGGGPQYGGYGGAPQYGSAPQPPQRSFVSRNGLSLATIGVTAGYLLILVFAHVAVLGILPLILGFRAVSRKEQLAIPAVVIGVLAFVLGIYEYTHR